MGQQSQESDRGAPPSDVPSRRGRRWFVASWAPTAIALLAIVSAAGKVLNTYGFFIYPDSYYYLLIARNIADHLHPAGTLGSGGMPFPPPGYAAMKASFPSVASVLIGFGVPMELTGHLVATGAAVLAVPAGYLAAKRLIGSRVAGVTAAALIATSFGLTYWSGFIMSDSLSVLLAFMVLALVARSRGDAWSNAGDLATGVVLAFLLLSRPTYFVAVPLLAWVGTAAFAWTRRRLLSAGAAGLFVTATIASAWFPPSSFTRVVLGNLGPILGLSLAAGGAAVIVMRRIRARPHLTLSPGAFAWLLTALASVIPLAYGIERAIRFSTGDSPYIGFGRFVARDPATIILLIPGALAVALYVRRDIGVALVSSAVVLFGVYYWVEPRESRYLIHSLPFLVPIASASPLLLLANRDSLAPRHREGHRARRLFITIGLWTVTLVAVAAVGLQIANTLSRERAPFLRTAYPREVASGLSRIVKDRDMVISALPWPYYFHLGRPTWAASATLSSSFLKVVSPGQQLLVIEDASMRYHYPGLAKALGVGLQSYEVARFRVPVGYQYGYFSAPDRKPVTAYRISARLLSDHLAAQGLRKGTPPVLAPTEPMLR